MFTLSLTLWKHTHTQTDVHTTIKHLLYYFFSVPALSFTTYHHKPFPVLFVKTPAGHLLLLSPPLSFHSCPVSHAGSKWAVGPGLLGQFPTSCREIDESEVAWWLLWGVFGELWVGQAPSHTKQAELMATLRRERVKERQMCIYVQHRWISRYQEKLKCLKTMPNIKITDNWAIVGTDNVRSKSLDVT